jgi:3-oxoacyl-[acyl-carrier protein] reductase
MYKKIAIVTGGGKGIGLDITKQLIKSGYFVVVGARSKIDIKSTSVEYCELDLLNSKSIERFLSHVRSKHERVDVIINNAGGSIKNGKFFELNDADWFNVYELNLMSIVRLLKGFDDVLSNNARIVNISSITGLQPGYYNPHYSSVKAAVINISKHLSMIYAERNILVNTICPGVVFSSSLEKMIKDNAVYNKSTYDIELDKFISDESSKTLLGKLGKGEDVASLVDFLISDKAGWITGSCFTIDGGKLKGVH